MTIKAQILLEAMLLVVLVIIIQLVKKRLLELKYVLIWLIGDVALIIVVFSPELLNRMARILGIQSPMNMVFFLGLLFALMIIFSLTVALSRVTGEVRRLAQIIAMLPEELGGKSMQNADTKENQLQKAEQ